MAYFRAFTSAPKKKKKLTKEEKEALLNFEKMQAKWDKQYGKLTQATRRPAEFPQLKAPPGRESRAIPSRFSSGGDTSVKVTQQYTGTVIKGLGQMHKSNLVPIIQQEDAEAIARMRR